MEIEAVTVVLPSTHPVSNTLNLPVRDKDRCLVNGSGNQYLMELEKFMQAMRLAQL